VPFCGSMGLGQSQHQVMERVLSYSISGNVALILSLCGDSVLMFCFIVFAVCGRELVSDVQRHLVPSFSGSK